MRSRIPTILWSLIFIMIALIGLSFFAFGGPRISYNPFKNGAASLFNISADIRQWMNEITTWRNLANENRVLKEEVTKNLVDQAKIQSLQDENAALRAALGLSRKINRSVIPGGIFQISLAPDGYSAFINKGLTDGVANGDAVTSPDGILVGTVQHAFQSSSRVTLISDPAFQVTARVLNGKTTGIAHGQLNDGLRLDLILQSDAIAQGDTLVSTGDDMIPAGLIVGTVKFIQNNEAKLFKTVTVSPSWQFTSGGILIIK